MGEERLVMRVRWKRSEEVILLNVVGMVGVCGFGVLLWFV